jgi:hypothetical protein
MEKNFPTTQKQDVEKKIEIKSSIVENPHINFYDGKIGPYDLKLKDLSFKGANGPKLSDLTKSMSKVTLEAFKSKFFVVRRQKRTTFSFCLSGNKLEKQSINFGSSFKC